LLAHEIIRRLPQGTPPTLMDVGTGSGCLAVTLARSGSIDSPGEDSRDRYLHARARDRHAQCPSSRRRLIDYLVAWRFVGSVAGLGPRGYGACHPGKSSLHS
jgi:2-polyprenyl-3-methyl-5-hydroxy-6-metoxy-1,4-benzoquinol methylase